MEEPYAGQAFINCRANSIINNAQSREPLKIRKTQTVYTTQYMDVEWVTSQKKTRALVHNEASTSTWTRSTRAHVGGHASQNHAFSTTSRRFCVQNFVSARPGVLFVAGTRRTAVNPRKIPHLLVIPLTAFVNPGISSREKNQARPSRLQVCFSRPIAAPSSRWRAVGRRWARAGSNGHASAWRETRKNSRFCFCRKKMRVLLENLIRQLSLVRRGHCGRGGITCGWSWLSESWMNVWSGRWAGDGSVLERV